MSKEIEKKFLLARLPQITDDGIKIRQGYLSVGDPEVRVRMKGEKFFLTRKGGAGFVREENEYEISSEIFEILWSLVGDAKIEKTRYEIRGEDGLTWEIDEFQTRSTKGLFLAEVELPDETFSPKVPPVAADVIIADVTTDPAYKNKNLAVGGISVEE